MDEVRREVDARLARFFDDERRAASGLASEALELVEAIAALTMRGGKRLRPAVLVAAFRAVEPERDWRLTVDAGAALEVLQSYLLIHDDWMDGDDQRRGGPSVHAALGAKLGDAHLGASLAILAGDLGSAYAQRLFLGSVPHAARPVELHDAFVRMQVEVVMGQSLDLLASTDVSRMQQLKTGSYTVAGPLRMGALIGGASDAQLEALEAFGTPLGEAFQVRDDLLGTFGDPRQTGKPSGNDLRAGKRTALVLECERLVPASERGALTRVLGKKDATDADVAAATELFVKSGARKNVEQRLARLLDQACSALEGGTLLDPGRTMLRDLAGMLAIRDR
ncbi:polyprenyl synthetase family protein [Sandaracinus amylolyticus]|uniref:polyprenyl synthetase family protein n=1 Tax=Sandaracinus amylolyticus TaxID=927083 RepID=UPI00069D279A|nr:polyprenyl synthetase family protein [Sandaracinus amylolyticus]